jgi:propionyl-CoA carboxylase alpha chain
MTITRILVANRGEIARRVFRTCRDLGYGTVAVFSDADAASPHIREADAAVRLNGTAPADTYLRVEAILAAAHRAGADAIHPGYGFLSENANFALAVQTAGLTWIGPAPAAIAAMGSKVAAKRLMADAGVPVLPELDPRSIAERDLPVLVKASAGGGGRGMRIVRQLADLDGEVAAARDEASSAFGDPTVFCEPYLPTGRHVEVQVLADDHGTIWAAGERECSIQRRHQKVLEETPSPLVERVDGMRDKLFAAARAAAAAIGYTGAGTVEFLADDSGEFYFLEMNTRLQVEHPVTECTTRLDLVALQIAVADGGHLDRQPPPATGAAIEARLYAEDPTAGWQAQSGRLHRFAVPGVHVAFDTEARRSGIRLDSGVVDGSMVGVHYDPMLAKVISWAPTRAQAVRALAESLQRAEIHGVRTNRDLLVNLLRHPAFRDGGTDTAFLDRHGLSALAAPLVDGATERFCAFAAALALDARARAAAPVLRAVPSGWRNVRSAPQSVSFVGSHGRHDVSYRHARRGLVAEAFPGVEVVAASADRVVLEDDGVRRCFRIAVYAGDVYVDSALGPAQLREVPRFPDVAEQIPAGTLLAPMPGTVVRLATRVGDRVRAGRPILWLEAMKMQHEVSAPRDGVVRHLAVAEGQQVDVGTVLAVVDDGAGEPTQEGT